MPGFQYRLQVLLDQKNEAKQRALEELAARQRELLEEREKLEELEVRREELAERCEALRRAILEKRSSIPEIQMRVAERRGAEQDLESARDDVFSQRMAVEESEERVAQARAELAERSREVEVLNKHREKCERRFAAERQRREAQEQEEIGAMLFQSKRRPA